MIVTDQVTPALPAHRLIRILAQELKKRLRWWVGRRSGYKWILWVCARRRLRQRRDIRHLQHQCIRWVLLRATFNASAGIA